MTTTNRKTLMWVLLILLFATLFLGGGAAFGTVEFSIWFGLLAIWVVAFFAWARRGPKSHG